MLLSLMNQTVCMAVLPISHKDQTHFMQYLMRRHEPESSGCNTSIYRSSSEFRGWRLHTKNKMFSKAFLRFVMLENAPCRKKTRLVCQANEHSTNEEQLRVLDSYFRKVHGGDQLSSGNVDRKMEFTDQSDELKLKQGLQSLDAYLGKVQIGN